MHRVRHRPAAATRPRCHPPQKKQENWIDYKTFSVPNARPSRRIRHRRLGLFVGRSRIGVTVGGRDRLGGRIGIRARLGVR